MSPSTNGVAHSEVYYPYPINLELPNKPIDEIRKLKVAVIGAGLTGITAGILLPAKVPGVDVTIFEKNADVVSPTQGFLKSLNLTKKQGGTWLENTYPGVRLAATILSPIRSTSND